MNKTIKRLIIAFIIISLIKILLTLLVPSPSMWSDEFFYARSARGIFMDHSFSYDGIFTNNIPPLYSILISPAYLFNDMNYVYFIIKFINAILSSLIIFPSFLLVREFFKEKESFIIAITTGIIPPLFSTPAIILSENLFYPLFMLTIYFLYKSYLQRSIKFDILTGISLGLLYLTRNIAIIILPAIAFISLINIIKKKRLILEIKKKLMLFITFLIIISPWLIRNMLHFGFSLNGLLGTYSNAISRVSGSYYSFGQFLLWILPYFAAIILGTGIIFGICAFISLRSKNEKIFNLGLITFFSTLFFILIAAHHNATSSIMTFFIQGKVLIRYISPVIPLVLITGFISLKDMEMKKIKLKKYLPYFIVSTFILAAGSILLIFNLVPVNNSAISYIGLFKYLLDLIFNNYLSFIISTILLISLPLLSFWIFKRFKIKSITKIFLIIFLLIGLTNYAMISYNSSKFWDSNEITELGKWINNQNFKGTFLIDETGCTTRIQKRDIENTLCDKSNHASLLTFWINNPVKIGEINNLEEINYIITKQKLKFTLLKETKNKIKLYRTP